MGKKLKVSENIAQKEYDELRPDIMTPLLRAWGKLGPIVQ